MIQFINTPQKCVLAGVPEGYSALALSAMARQVGDVLHVCTDDVRLFDLASDLSFFASDIDILSFPAWDTVPYDRVSPQVDLVAKRLDTLSTLALQHRTKPRITLTTVSALLQRVPSVDFFKASFAITVGQSFDQTAFLTFLERNGYQRSEQVMEAGEFAIRGGIIDVFASGYADPLRLDLFGDDLETLRTFDALTQCTTGQLKSFVFRPVSEVVLDSESIARFRTNYRNLFGAGLNDVLYESISQGRRFQGMEHWLPLFHEGLDTLFAFVPECVVCFDYQTDQAIIERLEQISEYYNARIETQKNGLVEGGIVYHPVPMEQLFLDKAELERYLVTRSNYLFFPFVSPSTQGSLHTLDMGAKTGKDFSAERAIPNTDLYEAVRLYFNTQRQAGRTLILTAYTAGSRDRIAGLLRDRLLPLVYAQTWEEALASDKTSVAFVILPIEQGFETPDLCVVTEADILGDRLVRPARRKKRGAQFIADISSLVEGDLVVHVDHGIGRFEGLKTLQVGNAPHDCVCVVYADNDKLFVPVENIEVLSRYGSENTGVILDKLGGYAWQARKSKLKKRIRDMAEGLMKIAAERYIRKAEKLLAPEGVFDDFCARFPYTETEDQNKSIQDVLNDLTLGRPMDRLVCGDVGFGKTEVALRAAFVTAMNGMQVAVVVPTTLLARQHHETFVKRLAGFPLRIGTLSRLINAKNTVLTKKEMGSGTLDIVVGTHALLAKNIQFKNLGLLIVDEEQHFGVAHKERLKQLKSNVHVLTLTATPIPRTLQMALTGVRELSIIATPPIDRLAVRTFVLPFDPVIIKEALMREHLRGGQSFYVCPRIADMDEVAEKIHKIAPEIKIVMAHGQMTPTQLEDIMTAFADKKYDVLLSTTIIESGLDMPSVNTMIIHRADMFGLAQLYQLRGRVGRGKVRAYAYLTLPARQKINKVAHKRMEVMQKLDTLGAGFTLASFDMDIRGAGNLLGDEQSGHMREVGIELYQKMLEEAVAQVRGGVSEEEAEKNNWSPQITAGMPVLIPETYVKDLGVRMGLYRRLAEIIDLQDIESFAAELVDRFGSLPNEVENLLEIIAIKTLCKKANVEKIDAGPKGAVVSLRNNSFPNPSGLVKFIAQNSGSAKIKPDHKIVYMRVWDIPQDRIRGIRKLMEQMANLAVIETK